MKNTENNIEKTRKAYARTHNALKAYTEDLKVLFAKIPNDILAEYSGDMKDIAPGSHFANIKAECEALKADLIANGVKKGSVRQYWLRAFNPVLADRGIKKNGKPKATKATKATKASKKTETGGYTRENVISAITQITAWIRDNEEPDFNASETMKGLNMALTGLNKVIINK